VCKRKRERNEGERVCVRGGESESVWERDERECMWEGERVREWESERGRVCERVCVCDRGREGERVCVR